MPRLNPPDVEQMSEHQRRVYDAIASGPRGKVRGPLAIWLHRPGLAEHAQALGQYCRYDSSLPPRLSELAILTMAALWRAPFEWWAHHPIALKAGLDADVAEQIRAGATPVFAQRDESLVYRFVRELVETRRVPDALYQEAIEVLGKDGVVDLVGMAGYYTLISMTLSVFDIPTPDGSTVEFGR
ncbi:carboxymuconolactone decarboxylase family protein [Pigmentiphaga sp.]|uniref:carboxymuconolactone decarboxylase family protein n=1 Tax=Pigmentiphaga sp. TaxID=1977564 RepID=UPI00128B53F3|nr:carboxymuconolactone decarboxylase family protein [Pigmentiphaga sp.]MPS30257.1 carboxymuconolactone decarboxylase family protein [Alcaligenaceae bacterium SAGV5]MPS55044.1 carboxymuconolactone decarboxylase family protein [Alcaligenaceae bacterium SAGV3]MPT59131.1 carboxymuconolactone decarboxylase family protein [Alcaligenaceae bacterium]